MSIASQTVWKFLGLLTISNIFMNFAWYGHLKFKASPLWLAIAASWGLALFEYCFQVPANRIGAGALSVMQLKILQECVTLVVFVVFAYFAFGETLRWNHIAAFICVFAAVGFAFVGHPASAH